MAYRMQFLFAESFTQKRLINRLIREIRREETKR